MGLMDLFMSKESRIKRHHRRLTNIDAAEEDRDASAHWLANDGSPQAILALMSRFDMTLDHQLKDSAEKDTVQQLLLQHGSAIREPLETWLKQCKRIARPLQLLSSIGGDDAVFAIVYQLLAKEVDGDPFKPEKRQKLLVWLAEHKHAGALDAARPFLVDLDENVRYAAAEVLINQSDDEARPLLESVLAREEEDSNRLKGRIAEIYVARRWTLDDPASVEGRLPPGHKVDGARIVPA